jgi:hypothetical protein
LQLLLPGLVAEVRMIQQEAAGLHLPSLLLCSCEGQKRPRLRVLMYWPEPELMQVVVSKTCGDEVAEVVVCLAPVAVLGVEWQEVVQL